VTLVLRYAARSDRGLVRANNEDSVYAGARLLALADGMGGHAAGEVASQLVIAALAHLDDDEPGGDLLGKLDSAVREGNSAIAAHVEADPELEGMGTTLTAILFAGNRLGLVHIGDSRGYLMREGELNQITKDDTFVQTLVDEGRITAEEAHSHPQRSLIMRALTGHEVEPTLIMREARAGDRYLLCSDGLSDPVSHETILEALQIQDVAESADRLIELALRGGGPDNVTVVVADVIDYDYGGRGQRRRRPSRTAQYLGRTRLGVQPETQRRQTRCAATGRTPPAAAAVTTTDDHRSGAARSGGAVRARHRPRDSAKQLLRQRARRHRLDHAGCSGFLSRYRVAGAVSAGLPQCAK
jgi:serine/threonine protein phosphatase PrpC